jgi:hypothetical protein
MHFPKEKIRLYILVAIAVIVKLVLLQGITGFRIWEANEMAINYLNTGHMLYNHDGVMVYNYDFPVYPFLLFLVYKVFGINYTYAIILNIVFSAITAILLYDVFGAFFDRFNLPEKVQTWKPVMLLISVAAFLFHPLIMYYELKNIHPFAMTVFFYSWALWWMVKFFKNDSFANLTMYAIVLGLAILSRTTLVAVVVPFFFWALQKYKWKKALVKVLYVGILASLFTVGLVYDNYKKTGKIAISNSLGIDIWKGTLAAGEGTNNLANGQTFYSALPDSDAKVFANLPANERNSFYMDKYLKTLQSNPKVVIEMFFIKLKNFWLFRKNMGIDYPDNVRVLVPVYMVFYLLILLLAIYAAIMIKREAWILLSFPIALSIIQAMVYVETRHRIMIEPILIFLAIIGVALLLNGFRKNSATNFTN